MPTDYYNENLDFLKEHSSFCIYPYIHLEIKNHRTTSGLEGSPLCCSANGLDLWAMTKFDNGNVVDNFHMPKFNSIRDEMKNNLPVNCTQQCPLDKKNTLRTVINNDYIQDLSFKKIIDSPTLIRINWKFGNICNLACRMCTPYISSHFDKILSQSNHSDTLEKYRIVERNNGVAISTRREDLEKLKFVLPNLQILQTSGGEPFLSQDLDELLKTAIKTKDCEHIELEITTNGTKFIKEKLDIISKFKKTRFIVSIDGTDTVYNYIRYPFKFKILKRRLQYLKKYIQERQLEDKISVQFNPMGMLYNLFNYAELQELYDEMFYYGRGDGGFNIDFNLTGFFTLNNINHHYHILHLKFAPTLLIDQALTSYQSYQETKWYKDLEYIYNQKQDNSYHLLIKEYTDILDNMYDQKYYKHLPQKIVKFLNE